jgi:hypothetical protein
VSALLSWLSAFYAGHRGAIDFALVVAITSMPAPDASSGKFYTWIFRSTHLAVGAVWRALAGSSWEKLIPFNGEKTNGPAGS